MGQRHKHADVIIAWAEGKDVQVWDENNKCWLDVVADCPKFRLFDKYRIKPPAKKYRVALFCDGSEGYTSTADNQETSNEYEGMYNFARWLTDWIEYSD